MKQTDSTMTQGGQQKDFSNYDGSDRVVSSTRLKHEYSVLPPVESIKFSPKFFPTLLRKLDGFRQGELIVVSGPTKNGKTLLAQSLTAAFSDSNINSLWFSYEVPLRQFIAQFDQSSFPKFFTPREIHARKFDWFEDRVIEAWQRFNNYIVFIDHFHFLFDMAKVKNPSLELGAYLRRIKTFAVQNNLIVFLLCHIKKIDKGAKATANDIRDSSFFGQESDAVIMVNRLTNHDKTIDETELTIEYSRHSGAWDVDIPLVKKGAYLLEKETKYPY